MNQSKMSFSSNIIRTVAFLFICTLIASCAQIGALSGGAKDETPPKVVKYSPDSAQLNFSSKKIEIFQLNKFIKIDFNFWVKTTTSHH